MTLSIICYDNLSSVSDLQACVTGRRLIQDETKDYRTLLVGGVKAQRLSIVEYETSIEVLNQYGETSCLKSGRTTKREGAAGAFFNSGGER